MPWEEKTVMSQRMEFVQLALKADANIAQLCRRFGISRKTGYKWLKRFVEGGVKALEDRSRRPHRSPGQSPASLEASVVAVRNKHPTWGGRKVQAFLKMKGEPAPRSPNTVTAILKRHDLIDPEEALKHKAFQSFEMEEPNDLLQMDFKGYFAMTKGNYCHPLTVLDDHSRFLLGLRACSNERAETVEAHLTDIFRLYGLPKRMLMDNGSPWGDDRDTPYTILTTWLMRLGIRISHSRPYHPQTLGKEERLHRTLKEDVISRTEWPTLDAWQHEFDQWRHVYNHERPHEAIGMKPPGTAYRPSSRPFPEPLPPVTYDAGEIIRKVDSAGKISFRNRVFRIGKGFRGHPIAIRPTDTDGVFDVHFCKQKVAQISFLDDNC